MNDVGAARGRQELSAEDVIVELVRAAGGTLHGKTRLFKAFYLAHLFFWQREGRFLTSHPIVRMPNGPGIDDAEILFSRLQGTGRLRTTSEKSGPYQERVFQLGPIEGDVTALDAEEVSAIREAVAFVDGKTAAELSALTHEASISWQEARDGEEMAVYMDTLSDEELARIRHASKETSATLEQVFGELG